MKHSKGKEAGNPKKHRVLKTILLLFLMLLCYTNVLNQVLKYTPVALLDKAGEEYIDNTLVRAAASFTIVRSLNGAISMVQESSLAGSPGGVGINMAWGQLLDPLNDFIEKVSYVLFMSTLSLAIQKFVYEVSQVLGIKILLSCSILLLIIHLWSYEKTKGKLSELAAKLLLLALFIRFLMPVVGTVNNALYEKFMASKYEQVKDELEIGKQMLEDNDDYVTHGGSQGFWGKLRNSVNIVSGVTNKINAIKRWAENSYEKLMNICMIFIVQTILVPLLTLMLMKYLLEMLIGKNRAAVLSRQIHEIGMMVSHSRGDRSARSERGAEAKG